MEWNQPQPNKEFYKQVSEVKFQSLLNWSELMNWIVIYGMVLQLMEWMVLQIMEWMNGISNKGWMNDKECMVMDECIYNYSKDIWYCI